MDPLSEVISLLRPRSYAFRGLDAGAQWALSFPPGPGIRCYAVVAGHCRLERAGSPALRLSGGDVVLLTDGKPFVLTGGAVVDPTPALAFLSATDSGHVATLNGGGEFIGLGGYFAFQSTHAGLLMDALPDVTLVNEPSTGLRLRSSIEGLMTELRDPRPGGALIAEHLAQGLLVQALRLHLAPAMDRVATWLCGLSDPRISPVMTAMHAEPGKRWTLADLARIAGMSRSAFAARFNAVVGQPALSYLTRWRMTLAAEQLTTSRTTLAAIAASLGYESEGALSTAFKRQYGLSPRAFLAQGAAASDHRQ